MSLGDTGTSWGRSCRCVTAAALAAVFRAVMVMRVWP